MPELPEVETICRGLRSRVVGRRIVDVEVLEPRLRTRIGADFASTLNGRVITAVRRRAKYILIDLDDDSIWLTHLGMSGKLIWVAKGRRREKHDHIIVKLDRGNELRYHDPRRFGLSLVTTRGGIDALPQLKTLGPEPLDGEFNTEYLYGTTRGSRRRIRDLLIDQTAVAGLGNIYANEILFHAGVRPTARAWKLRRSEVERVAQLTPKILREAIRWCGTSFSDYRDAEDRYGNFQKHLRVYDREREKCRVCGAVIKRVAVGNRSAFYCPRCQK
ncbi:MAG TPA: bifunctional DNA-formamidopyrimidine glycosylase/DNA-(apurinic or apyrimidinic site) lyase [Candidatus Binatia bacterium]|nr:bifunctional DNA-formamidopyrimidine glycosylase/DNA-(apurinic or apyrimidinic site) lyase [Candidatus Binatia bacterium]